MSGVDTPGVDGGVSVLGLGAMGRAIAGAALRSGAKTTVWNRSGGKAEELVAAGAVPAASAEAAVAASGLVVVCVLDDTAARSVVEPLAQTLRGRTLVNLTTTTPEQARRMATWAREHDVAYLDGGIMATPDLLGGPDAIFLFSGSEAAFSRHRAVLDLLGEPTFLGDDAGLAALVDLALLAAMYAMLTGFQHAAAMVEGAGIGAARLASLAVPWLQAMTAAIPFEAAVVDSRDYTTDTQSLAFTKSALDSIVAASRAQGVGTQVLDPILALVEEQIAAGHGDEIATRTIEGIRRPGVGPS